jgi:hypothetical protein
MSSNRNSAPTPRKPTLSAPGLPGRIDEPACAQSRRKTPKRMGEVQGILYGEEKANRNTPQLKIL